MHPTPNGHDPARVGLGVAVVCLVAATAFWAVNYVVGAAVVDELGPVGLTLLRWSIAVLPLFALAQLIERPDWRAVLRHWPRLLVMAALGMVGYNLALYAALRFTTPVSASLINALNPALIALVAAILLRERLGGRRIAGILLGLIGVALVLTRGSIAALTARELNPGDLLMLVAITVWTAYTLLGRRLRAVPPVASTAVQAAMTVAIMAPVGLLTGMVLPASAGSWTALVVIGILPSVGSYLLWNVAVRRISAGSAGVFLNLITVFTVVASLLLGGTIGWAQVVGGILVLGGVALTVLPGRGARAPAADARA